MFGSHKPEITLEQARLLVLQDFDDRWTASKLMRPSHFGDGRPFEPDPLVAELRDVFWRSCHTLDSERVCDEYGLFILLMATLHDPRKVTGRAEFLRWLQCVSDLLMGLIARGAAEDERTVSRFLLYLMEYWKSTGQLDAWIASAHGMTTVEQLLEHGE